jgi:hypothetical protein
MADTQDSRFRWADLLPWSAFLISMTSLGFTIYQGWLSRQHDRMSVRPFLHLQRFGGKSALSTFGISVENNGVGPAVIDRLDIVYNNHAMESIEQLRDDLLKSVANLSKGKLTYTTISSGEYFRTGGAERHLIEGVDIDVQAREALWDQLTTKVEMKLYYCSIYEDCFAVCLNTPIAACQKLHLLPQAADLH